MAQVTLAPSRRTSAREPTLLGAVYSRAAGGTPRLGEGVTLLSVASPVWRFGVLVGGPIGEAIACWRAVSALMWS